MNKKKPTPRKPKPLAVFVHFGGAYIPLYWRLKKRAARENRSVPALIRIVLASWPFAA